MACKGKTPPLEGGVLREEPGSKPQCRNSLCNAQEQFRKSPSIYRSPASGDRSPLNLFCDRQFIATHG